MSGWRTLWGQTIDALVAPRSLPVLLSVSLIIGVVFAFSMLPLPFVLGTSAFWSYPRGTIPGSDNDMAQVLVGYLYLQHGPWMLPLLFVPKLGAPAGTNIFWLDAIPWVSLLGKLIFTATGVTVNLLGAYLLACLSLPGVAMTMLLAVVGQRSVLAMLAGTLIAVATPYLLFRWGHMATFAHFFILLALALYLKNLRTPREIRMLWCWLLLLTIAILNNMYIFVMVGGCWAAALVQRRFDRTISTPRMLQEAAGAIGLVAVIALVTGIATPELGSAGSHSFGVFSMNLASPFTPQMSGVIAALRHFRVGMNGQYEGFSYLGLGVLLLSALLIPRYRWVLAVIRRHPALLGCLLICLLFALSNRVYLGSHLLLDLPLPASLVQPLGTFRSSGRFFWPLGYSLVAISILSVLRTYRPPVAAALLGAACVLQLIDTAPLRAAIANSATHAAPGSANRMEIDRLVRRADAVTVFPSFGCTDAGANSRFPYAVKYGLFQVANMEFQLAAARANLSINSVDNARLKPDCAAEERSMSSKLRPGTATVYLTPFYPTRDQLGGYTTNAVCGRIDWIAWCLVPRD